jgi:ABC-2 type transport system permease protein
VSVLFAQLKSELRVIARNGEQLLVIIGIPTILLIFFSQVDVLPRGDQNAVDFLLPGILALAVMSTAMVSLGIATGFERSYGVLKRLGATPLGTQRLVLAKCLAVVLVEVVQLLVLVGVGLILGWRGDLGAVAPVVGAVLLGTLAFAGIGLTLAGTLRGEVNLAAQNGLYLVLLLIGGIMFPLDSLPSWLQTPAELLPSSALADVMRGALTETSLNGGAAWIVLAVWALVAPTAAAKLFRWQ